MNLNKIKSNITNRDWSSKSKKTNINYIKTQLKNFGLSIPKYLTQNKLTDKQIQAQSKRILKSIEKEQSVIRQQSVISNKQKAEKRAYDRAYAKYVKTAMKHNERAFKMTNYAMTKLNKFTSNVRDYMQGKELNLSERSNITYQMSNSPFAFEDYENIEFANAKAINRRIATLEKQNRKLTEKQVDKLISKNGVARQNFESKLQGYVDAGNISENDKKLLLEQFDRLDGLQQGILITNVVSKMKDKYPSASKEEEEEINTNIVNKILDEINNVSTYL